MFTQKVVCSALFIRSSNMRGVTDGQVVRAGVSVTWNVLSWSGGHEFEPWLGRTWGALYFCPKSYLNQNIFYFKPQSDSLLFKLLWTGCFCIIVDKSTTLFTQTVCDISSSHHYIKDWLYCHGLAVVNTVRIRALCTISLYCWCND